MSIQKRKLQALGYQSGEINLNDRKQVSKLVVWLEENHIKHYKQSKTPFHNVESNDWIKHYSEYLSELGSPLPAENLASSLDWCLGYAVQRKFLQNKDGYNKYAVENLKATNVPNVVADNPLDHLNFTGNEFKEGITNLANTLKIPSHPNPLVTLEACTKVIQKRLNSKALENPNDIIIKGTPFPVKDADLGFELNDKLLNEAAKLLRLLYIQDLRNLQTRANECIVAVQSVTADPKTDTKLGKVGK